MTILGVLSTIGTVLYWFMEVSTGLSSLCTSRYTGTPKDCLARLPPREAVKTLARKIDRPLKKCNQVERTLCCLWTLDEALTSDQTETRALADRQEILEVYLESPAADHLTMTRDLLHAAFARKTADALRDVEAWLGVPCHDAKARSERLAELKADNAVKYTRSVKQLGAKLKASLDDAHETVRTWALPHAGEIQYGKIF